MKCTAGIVWDWKVSSAGPADRLVRTLFADYQTNTSNSSMRRCLRGISARPLLRETDSTTSMRASVALLPLWLAMPAEAFLSPRATPLLQHRAARVRSIALQVPHQPVTSTSFQPVTAKTLASFAHGNHRLTTVAHEDDEENGWIALCETDYDDTRSCSIVAPASVAQAKRAPPNVHQT